MRWCAADLLGRYYGYNTKHQGSGWCAALMLAASEATFLHNPSTGRLGQWTFFSHASSQLLEHTKRQKKYHQHDQDDLAAVVLRRMYSKKVTSSARAREQMRLNQQREAKPAQPGPKGIPPTVPVGITNIIPTGLPAHPNAPKPAFVMVVSAAGDPTRIGDCPFSQRVLMTLEEKHLPYEGRFIDVENKPTWFLQMYPEGNVPTMFIDQKWVGDADIITEMVEKKISIPTMRTPPEKASIGLNIFPSFMIYLRSNDPGDGSEQALLAELQALDEHLKNEDAAYKNPFVNGRFPSMLDMNLAPKLYRMDVALRHFKKWSLPPDMVYLEAYMKKLFTRPSFTKTKAPEDLVIRGCQRHLTFAKLFLDYIGAH